MTAADKESSHKDTKPTKGFSLKDQKVSFSWCALWLCGTKSKNIKQANQIEYDLEPME